MTEITIVPMGRGTRDEWSGMFYEVRAPYGYNFGAATHAYLECGKRAAIEIASRLELTKCEADCDCCWSDE